MEKLLIEVVSGVMYDTAYVYDVNGDKICEASGYDSFEAIKKVSLKLSEEIINIKNNKKQIDFFKNVAIGTKVKYKVYNEYRYGYFAEVDEDRGLVIVSYIPYDDNFTGVKMTGYGMCEKINAKLVELYEGEQQLPIIKRFYKVLDEIKKAILD